MIHHDNRSHAEELAHHTVAWRELRDIVGHLENDARTFYAHVVVGGVPQRGQDIVEIDAAGAQTQSHLAGSEGVDALRAAVAGSDTPSSPY